MVILGVPFDCDGGGVELFCLDLLYLLDLMLEGTVFVLRKHILEFVVELLLSFLVHLQSETVSIEGVCIRLS